jgi:hypothetical protein
MADSYPKCLDVTLRRPLAYLQTFGSLSQFGHPSVGDKPNFGLIESRGTHVVTPKSE